jgi:Uncharacterised nucleotidyltransferase
MTPEDLLVAIAGHGLHPSPVALTEFALSAQSWQHLLTMLSRELVLGLALLAADSGALLVTAEQRADLIERLALARDGRSAADRCLDEVVASLDREGIETCVLHGVATAALDYDEPELRLYDTLHLLIPPMRREEAVTALVERGVLRPNGTKRRTKRQSSLMHLSRDGVRVVLYTSLTPRNFGAVVEASDLSPNRITFTPRSVELSALGREERLIAACVHARLNEFRKDLLAQRDVVQLVLREDLSVRKVERQAASWRLEAVVADAVRAAWETFHVPDVVPISAWSRSYRPYGRDRRRLAAYPQPSFEV